MDDNILMMKFIKKKRFSFFAFAVMGILIIEIGALGLFNYLQPSYNTKITKTVRRYQAPTGGYYGSLQVHQPTLDSTYAALSINSILNKSRSVDNTTMLSYILSQYDTKTGLFYANDEPSLSATYSAIGSLALLNKLQTINASKTIDTVLTLRTNDSFFTGYNELNQSPSTGELDHLFEAAFILNTLFTNQTAYYLALNRTQILFSLLTLQYQGGFKENIQDQVPNMRNAFFVTRILANLGVSLTFFESLGFKPSSLISWIDQMYTASGFRPNQNSGPSPEATAYALISLERLGVSSAELHTKYEDGITFMFNSVGSNYLADDPTGSLDSLYDIVVALKVSNNLGMVNQLYLDPVDQTFFAVLIGLTVILLILLIILTMIQVFKEDESKYYETALKRCMKEVYESHGKELERLSFLLGEQITQVTFVFQEFNESVANLRALSEEHEFIILFDTFSWFPQELTKYEIGSRPALIGLNFLDKDVLYTIEEAIEVLKT